MSKAAQIPRPVDAAGCWACGPDAAVRAISYVCEQAEIPAADARVVGMPGEITVVVLEKAGLVARVADLVRLGRLRRELLVATYLSGAGIPVASPAVACSCRQLAVVGDRVITWWTYEPGERADWPQLARVLRRLHEVPTPVPRYLALPRLDPFARLRSQLCAATGLASPDLDAFARHIGALSERWAASHLAQEPELEEPETVLHGAAWPANTLAVGGRVHLLDLDHVAVGPIGYDLRALYAFGRLGWLDEKEIAEFRDGYGEPVSDADADLLADLHLVEMTGAYAALTAEYPHVLDQARLRIASLSDARLLPDWWMAWRPEPAC